MTKPLASVACDNGEALAALDNAIGKAIENALDAGARPAQINGSLLAWACMAAQRCGCDIAMMTKVIPDAWAHAQKALANASDNNGKASS